jgi:hypothetical protein
MSNVDMSSYVDVAERLQAFYAKHPEGSLQPLDPAHPFTWEELPDVGRVLVYTACAYRFPDDPRPGIGTAWEPFPGRTAYTRGSELMNAETSAWGRAIAALGIATRRGIATAQDVERARARQQPDDDPGRTQRSSTPALDATRSRMGLQRHDDRPPTDAQLRAVNARLRARSCRDETHRGWAVAALLDLPAYVASLRELTREQVSMLLDLGAEPIDAALAATVDLEHPDDVEVDVLDVEVLESELDAALDPEQLEQVVDGPPSRPVLSSDDPAPVTS